VRTLLPAVIGGLVVLGGVAVTGGLSDNETRVVTVPGALTEGASLAEDPPPLSSAEEEAGQRPVQQIVRDSTPSVVEVEVITDESSQSGTGFLIDDDGTALTNEHVVEGANEVTIAFSDRSTSKARVVGTDPDIDLAVLRIEKVPAAANPLPLGRSAGLVAGDPVIAIGNPFGLAGTVTTGVVSALGRRIEAPSGNEIGIPNAIQTDAAINKGNSGGPLLDRFGRVIGINSQIFSQGGDSAGVGFAVPIDTIRPVARSIVATGEAQHAWIGISGRSLTPELAQQLKLSKKSGVLVVGLDARGPAKKAGLVAARDPEADLPKGGDVIVAIDGRDIDGMEDVSQEVASRAVGAKIGVTIIRDGESRDVTLTLADRPADIGRSG
jgi:S1-C subfamily serine protease